MRLDKGISPVLSVTVLIGAVIILGMSFMAYSISLSNAQSSEVRIRNMVVDEAAKVVIYIEKEDTTQSTTTIYLGLTKVIPETSKYYLILFKTNEYQSIYGLIPLSATISQIQQNIPPQPKTSSQIYVVETAGNYVPLKVLGLPSIDTYMFWYIPPNSSLIKIEISNNELVNFKYVVPIILVDFGNEYYEVARIYCILRWGQ
ncbi:MAG: hypothetical protein QXZ10_02665 [Sulfolobales archaeon]